MHSIHHLGIPIPAAQLYSKGVQLREAHEGEQDSHLPRPQSQPHRQPGEGETRALSCRGRGGIVPTCKYFRNGNG